MRTDSPHRFGRVLVGMLVDSGFAPKNHDPVSIRFTTRVGWARAMERLVSWEALYPFPPRTGQLGRR
jgi:hypothetical protein